MIKMFMFKISSLIKRHLNVLALISAGSGVLLLVIIGSRILTSKPISSTNADNVIMSSATDMSTDKSQAVSIIKEIIETKAIPFETETKIDASLNKQQSRVQTEGVDGEKKLVYKVIITGDQETSRELVSEEILKQPVKKVVIVGSREVANKITNNQANSNNSPANQTQPNTPQQPTQPPKPASNSHYDQAEAQKMLTFVNAERRQAGLSELYYNHSLAEYAKTRAREIVTLFDHTRPNGQAWYSLNPHLLNGENLLKANQLVNAQSAVSSWMNSEGHRANVLRSDFRSVGGALLYDDSDPAGYRYYWVQLFSLQ